MFLELWNLSDERNLTIHREERKILKKSEKNKVHWDSFFAELSINNPVYDHYGSLNMLHFIRFVITNYTL